MRAGLYAESREGSPILVWIPSYDALTALEADLARDSCYLVANIPGTAERAACLFESADEGPLPYRPAGVSEFCDLLEPWLPRRPSTIELTALAAAVLTDAAGKGPLFADRDSAANGAVLSAMTVDLAYSVASCPETESAVRAAVEDLLDDAVLSEEGVEASTAGVLQASYGNFRLEPVTVCLTSLRRGDAFEILEGSAGVLDEAGAERWFNGGVDVTARRDAALAFTDLDDAREGLLAAGVTAVTASAFPNLPEAVLADAVCCAMDEIASRRVPRTRGIGI